MLCSISLIFCRFYVMVMNPATIYMKYCKTSYISDTESQNLNVPHLVLQLSVYNPLKPSVKSRMKM